MLDRPGRSLPESRSDCVAKTDAPTRPRGIETKNLGTYMAEALKPELRDALRDLEEAADEAGAPVEDLRSLAEIDRRRLAGLERQHGGHLWVSGLKPGEEPAHRRVRAGEAVAAHQGTVDGGALDALTPPTRDPLSIGK